MAKCRDCGHAERTHSRKRGCRRCDCEGYAGGFRLPRRVGQALMTAGVVGGAVALSVPQSRARIADWLGVDESQLPSREQFVGGAQQILGPDALQLPPVLVRPAEASIGVGREPSQTVGTPETANPLPPPQPPTVQPIPPDLERPRPQRSDPPPPPALDPTPTGKQKKPHPVHPDTPVKKGHK